MARIDQVHMGVNPFLIFFLRGNSKLTSAPVPLVPYNMKVLFPVRMRRTPAEGAVAFSEDLEQAQALENQSDPPHWWIECLRGEQAVGILYASCPDHHSGGAWS
jgi:hypothetical protein